MSAWTALPPITSMANQCQLRQQLPQRLSESSDQLTAPDLPYVVKIHGVDVGDGRSPPLYAGPIEVFNQAGASLCTSAIELPKPPFMFGGKRYLYLRSGDAIDVGVVVLDLSTCKIAWKSKHYTWDHAPEIETTQITLGSKIIPIGQHCLPAMPASR